MASGLLGRRFTKEVINGPSNHMRGVARDLLLTSRADVGLVGWARSGDIVRLAVRSGLDSWAAAGDAIGIKLLVRLAVGALVGTATGGHGVKSKPTVRRRIRRACARVARQNPRDRGT